MFSTIFREPTILTYGKDFSASPVKSYMFSKNLFFVPLLQNEIARSSFDYPLVIAKTDEGIFPVALLSLRENDNLFVNDNGVWEKEFYIPSFLNTYPFMITKPKKNIESKIIYDKAYNGINKKESESVEIIKDKKLTQRGKKIFDKLQEHYVDFENTKHTYSEIDAMGLLKEIDVKMIGKDTSQQHVMKGFYQIDTEKLNTLEDKKLLKLAKSGQLGLVQFQLASLVNINKLTNRI